MDRESLKAAGLLAAIAESNYQMACFADTVRRSAAGASVSSDFECSKNSAYFDYGSGSSPYLFDWYVDVSFADGRAFAVIIELSWDDARWLVESRIEVPGELGPRSLFESPDYYASSIDELNSALSTATTEIIEAAKKAMT